MKESETFGAEKGSGEEIVLWMNEESKRRSAKFEARLYDYVIKTENFGTFEMFSWTVSYTHLTLPTTPYV